MQEPRASEAANTAALAKARQHHRFIPELGKPYALLRNLPAMAMRLNADYVVPLMQDPETSVQARKRGWENGAKQQPHSQNVAWSGKDDDLAEQTRRAQLN